MTNAAVEGGRELEFGPEEKAPCAICEEDATRAITTGAPEGEKPRDLSYRFDCPKCEEYQISHGLMCQIENMKPLSDSDVEKIRQAAMMCHKKKETLTRHHI